MRFFRRRSNVDFNSRFQEIVIDKLDRLERRIDLLLARAEVIETTLQLHSEWFKLINIKQEKTMSQIDELTSAVADVQTAVSATSDAITAIGTTVTETAADVAQAIALLEQLQSDNPQVAAAIDALRGVKTTLDSAGSNLSSAAQTLADSDAALDTALGNAPPGGGGDEPPPGGGDGGSAEPQGKSGPTAHTS
jgi:chromosome segregation ATPase